MYSSKGPFIIPNNHLFFLKRPTLPNLSPIKISFKAKFKATSELLIFPGSLSCIHEVHKVINFCLFVFLVKLSYITEVSGMNQRGRGKIISPLLQDSNHGTQDLCEILVCFHRECTKLMKMMYREH